MEVLSTNVPETLLHTTLGNHLNHSAHFHNNYASALRFL